MRFNYLVLYLLLTLFNSGDLQAQTGKLLEIGRVDTLTSRILGETRELWIYVPPGLEPSYAPRKYPVLYLLDAEMHFTAVVGLVQQLSMVNGNDLCPPMIVVGIPNTYKTRTRDLTPTTSRQTYNGQIDRMPVSSGGGTQFLEFLQQEVIPHVEGHYPALHYRLLVGHSFGGLTVLNAMATKPNLFQANVALDPSTWWDKNIIVNKLGVALKQPTPGRKLYVALANTLPAGRDTVRLRQDTSRVMGAMRANFLLVDKLRQANAPGLQWQWKYYPAETHGSLPLLATHDALRLLFKHPPQPLPISLTDGSFTLDAVRKYYSELSVLYGYRVLPPEDMINMYAWGYLQSQQLKKAGEFFRLNAANYPESFNAQATLGNYFVQVGEKNSAILLLEQALKIQDDPKTRRQLEQLKK
ncbi:alpha/beta hydrolase-fold protein [Hymenobacter glacieicola]|uniref:Periplasmic siderophore cleavage esterase IroE family protein n=1 Tax=Hymenobacter glacieicola TaxID=1562124 RepID=A0ABQ1WSI8_9BACT|nr:alpha/beta hydrolase-fold protein [Hymenobacter glacieicola]GGG44248.1 periplasmic siderophore cleavage esterase IroE family protein [Hymenobacter glacieicola]